MILALSVVAPGTCKLQMGVLLLGGMDLGRNLLETCET